MRVSWGDLVEGIIQGRHDIAMEGHSYSAPVVVVQDNTTIPQRVAEKLVDVMPTDAVDALVAARGDPRPMTIDPTQRSPVTTEPAAGNAFEPAGSTHRLEDAEGWTSLARDPARGRSVDVARRKRSRR